MYGVDGREGDEVWVLSAIDGTWKKATVTAQRGDGGCDVEIKATGQTIHVPLEEQLSTIRSLLSSHRQMVRLNID